jgi:hypothetical protein
LPGRRRFESPSRRRHPLPQPPSDSQLCFYHYNFGRQARNCQPPCRRQGNQ